MSGVHAEGGILEPVLIDPKVNAIILIFEHQAPDFIPCAALITQNFTAGRTI